MVEKDVKEVLKMIENGTSPFASRIIELALMKANNLNNDNLLAFIDAYMKINNIIDNNIISYIDSIDKKVPSDVKNYIELIKENIEKIIATNNYIQTLIKTAPTIEIKEDRGHVLMLNNEKM